MTNFLIKYNSYVNDIKVLTKKIQQLHEKLIWKSKLQ